jgi:hypothetical protein
MPAAPIIAAGAAVAGAGIAAVGTANQISANKKSAKANQRAAAYQRQMDNLRAARERRQAIRQARLATGAALQTGVNQGAADSSAALGGLGSIQSQLNSSLSFLDTNTRLADRASEQIGIANKYKAKADTSGAIAGLGMTLFKEAGGTGAVGDVFG